MHTKAALFSVFTGTLLLRHMVLASMLHLLQLAGGLFSQFISDILLLDVPPSCWTDLNGCRARRAQTFWYYFFYMLFALKHVAHWRCCYVNTYLLLLCKACEGCTRNTGCELQWCNENTWCWLVLMWRFVCVGWRKHATKVLKSLFVLTAVQTGAKPCHWTVNQLRTPSGLRPQTLNQTTNVCQHCAPHFQNLLTPAAHSRSHPICTVVPSLAN